MIAHPVYRVFINHFHSLFRKFFETLQNGRFHALIFLQNGNDRIDQDMIGFHSGSQKNVFKIFFLGLYPQPPRYRRMPLCQCTGFIKNNDVHIGHLFQSPCFFYQDVIFGCSIYAYHQSNGRHQYQSTRASHHPYGNG